MFLCGTIPESGGRDWLPLDYRQDEEKLLG